MGVMHAVRGAQGLLPSNTQKGSDVYLLVPQPGLHPEWVRASVLGVGIEEGLFPCGPCSHKQRHWRSRCSPLHFHCDYGN